MKIHQKDISKMDCLDLVICDEGHRLKNSEIQTSKAVALCFKTKKRIMLSGTPIQNNLEEFFAMVNWVNPGLLGTLAKFNGMFKGK